MRISLTRWHITLITLFMCELLCHSASGLKSLKRKNDNRPRCACGSSQNHVDRRVVGGHNAARGEFPYASGLLLKTQPYYRYQPTSDLQPYCGGTLITDKHVLTASHCVRGRNSEELLLDIGDYEIKGRQDGGKDKKYFRQAISLRKHPGYVKKTFLNDIAVIELDKPVDLNGTIRTAWLPAPRSELSPGTTVTVYGWGRLSYDGDSPNVLQTVDLPVMAREDCQRQFITDIRDVMLCAGGRTGKDACIGDSGSGLVSRVENENVIVGVVSFGKRCAMPGVPGVYAKVSKFVNWIYDQTRSATCHPCIAKM